MEDVFDGAATPDDQAAGVGSRAPAREQVLAVCISSIAAPSLTVLRNTGWRQSEGEDTERT